MIFQRFFNETNGSGFYRQYGFLRNIFNLIAQNMKIVSLINF